jgi:hypothetical protein
MRSSLAPAGSRGWRWFRNIHPQATIATRETSHSPRMCLRMT